MLIDVLPDSSGDDGISLAEANYQRKVGLTTKGNYLQLQATEKY